MTCCKRSPWLWFFFTAFYNTRVNGLFPANTTSGASLNFTRLAVLSSQYFGVCFNRLLWLSVFAPHLSSAVFTMLIILFRILMVRLKRSGKNDELPVSLFSRVLNQIMLIICTQYFWGLSSCLPGPSWTRILARQSSVLLQNINCQNSHFISLPSVLICFLNILEITNISSLLNSCFSCVTCDALYRLYVG